MSRAASRSNSTHQMGDWLTASTCLGEFTLQFFKRHTRRLTGETPARKMIILKIFEMAQDRFSRIETLAAASLFGKRLKLFFEFGFEPDTEHLFNMFNIAEIAARCNLHTNLRSLTRR